MFKQWSIKSLLQLWSFATVLAIVILASAAIYTDNVFSNALSNLTGKVLPVENANQRISAVSSLFITRQKQVIASSSAESIANLTPRAELESEFMTQWKKIAASLQSKEDSEIVNTLLDSYQQFLGIDSQLLSLILEQHEIHAQLENKIENVEFLEHRIQNNAEAIAGKVNLQRSLNRRSLRESTTVLTPTTEREQELIQGLSQSVRLNVLSINYLTQKLLQAENADNLLSLRENNIRQHESILTTDIGALKQKLHNNADLLLLTQTLDRDFQSLKRLILDGDLSIYKLRLKQIENTDLLLLGQQKSIEILKIIMVKFKEISSLISTKSLQTVSESSLIAQKTQWVIIVLSIMITLGMLRFITSISRRINSPLAELRSAMHALSSGLFDTRLKVNSGKSEFAVLSEDFNLFAENTQTLIDDLAEAKNSLQNREQHISAILNGVPEAILTLTSSGIIESTNPAAEKVLKADGKILIGLNINQFLSEQYSQTSLVELKELLANSQEFEGVDYKNNSFSMWLSLNRIPRSQDDLWVCVISDVTAWKQAEEDLRTTSTELDTILENAMVGIALIKNRKLVRVNNKFEQLFSCERALIEGQSSRCLYASDEIYEQLGEDGYGTLSKGESYQGEVRLARQDGSLFWGLMSGKALDSENPQEGSIWLFEDITLQRENDDKLRKLATLDTLTGLPNRGVFNDRLEHAIHKAHRNSTRLAVFFLDLDHFKHINDSLGHKAGDILLCEVSQRLKTCVREGDTVARLGGDEFTIILEEVRSAQHVAKVAEKVLATISKVFRLGNTEVNVSPSVGISLYPADGRDVDLLLRNADAAMYHAKNNGRNNFQFYSAEMNAQAAKRLAMETSLRRALDNNEFYLNFQPQINLATGRVSGAEVLLRWHNEQWGDVSPVEFVPILEDSGLIGKVGEIVIQQAIQAYLAVKEKVDPDFQIAVNLSGRQFQGGQLASFVQQALNETGMSAKNLELEITESVLMDDKQLAIETLNYLSELGITLAIDDFGTGYSSLSYLKQFPLNVLKIDRSFVRDITTDEDDAAIVDAILAMSRRLNLKVVAEGVEEAEQLAFLKLKGCETVQGYFFSKPLSFDDFEQFIEVNNSQLLSN